MVVVVNGEAKDVLAETNLFELLKSLDLPTERVAIELNREVVRRKNWETTGVKDADKIEIVHFVGGG
jgi:thiamine biosynthesis protein ThiS